MLHTNNIFNSITGLINNRFAYFAGEAPNPVELSEDPMSGINLDDPKKKSEDSKEDAKRNLDNIQQEGQKAVANTAAAIDEASTSDNEVSREKANQMKFELEVNRAKAEVVEKVKQLDKLMADIQGATSDLDFQYNRAVTTIMNMQHEIAALKFIQEGVAVPTDGEYAKELQDTMNDLTAKAKKMEADGKPATGGLSFDQIIQIMIAARTDHYKKYSTNDFKQAKLDREEELKKSDEKIAHLTPNQEENTDKYDEEAAEAAAQADAQEIAYATARAELEGMNTVDMIATQDDMRACVRSIQTVLRGTTSRNDVDRNRMVRDNISKLSEGQNNKMVYEVAKSIDFTAIDRADVANILYDKMATVAYRINPSYLNKINHAYEGYLAQYSVNKLEKEDIA